MAIDVAHIAEQPDTNLLSKRAIMIAVKVQCGCGQRYAFDIEPVEGRMPYPVACPACGADGTAAANEIIARESQAARPAPAAVRSGTAAPIRVVLREPPPPTSPAPAVAAVAAQPAASPAAPRPAKLLPGQLERPAAESQARAQIFWGDAPEEVVKFLMRHNIPPAEASELVAGYFAERAAALRSSGFSKIFTGTGMVCVPVASWFIFMAVGVLPMKIFALTVIVGIWGGWRLLRGCMMVTSPKSETGDVAEQ
jgi:hypothetical protein